MEERHVRLITVPGQAGTGENQRSPEAGRWEAGTGWVADLWAPGGGEGGPRCVARRGVERSVCGEGSGSRLGDQRREVRRRGGRGWAGSGRPAEETVAALLSASRGSPAAVAAFRPLLSGPGPAPSSTSAPGLPRKAVRLASAAFAFPSPCTLRFWCGARSPTPAMATLRVQPEAQAKVSAAGSRKGPLGRRGSETLQASVTRPPAPVASRGRGGSEPV